MNIQNITTSEFSATARQKASCLIMQVLKKFNNIYDIQ